ncbi:MAG: hypothetical protein JWO82_1818, partial [Akkermansiaceae bacterium]|nr:hypothetical protein [Akkermansiaceae bacterium]
LKFFESHPVNPAILLQTTPQDLGRIAKYIYRRVGGAKCPPMPEPPLDALVAWHRDYRAALNAFMFATTSSLANLQKADWQLPLSRASDWVRKEWLNKLDGPELENAICLAVLGAQELEILVQDEALPYPGRIGKLFELGLVAQTERGQLRQHRQFGLREAGWGRLILAALKTPADEEGILFATASRHLQTFIVLNSKLQRDHSFDRLKRLWASLAASADRMITQLFDSPLLYISTFLRLAKSGEQSELGDLFWQAIERQPHKLVVAVWASQLDQVGSFLGVARAQGRDTAPLWQAIESQPDRLAAAVSASQLDQVGSFLGVARAQGRDTAPLWQVIESQSDKLAAAVWASQLDQAGSFLGVARIQGRDTATLWQVIESQPDKLAAAAWATPLEKLGFFLEVARTQGRDTAPLWQAIENQPGKLAAAVWATPLEKVGFFLEVARAQGRDTEHLWHEFESSPGDLALRIWANPLGHVGSFLKIAKSFGRSSTTLHEVLRQDPDRLAAMGAIAKFGDLVGFQHSVPSELLAIVLRDIRPGNWDETPQTLGLVGATWLAWECGKAGREDLQSDLITLLLRRKNWRDFPTQSGGFSQVAWMLGGNVPVGAIGLKDQFTEAVCTADWLRIAYRDSKCGALASGLRQWALSQSMEQCRCFHHKGLGGRINKELIRIETADPKEQSQIIQLIGCAVLSGWAVSRRYLAGISPETVARLPFEIQGHRSESLKVEDNQLQLWLGLRVFVSLTRQRLPLSLDIIEETLELWRSNLMETASNPLSAAHRLNQSMVAWLETCIRAKPPSLLPSNEPLWTLTGFPFHLDLPRRTV